MGDYLFVPYSAYGHINPMLPVIAQLAKSGERVRVLVSSRFADAVVSVGASPIRLPMNSDVHVPDTSVVGTSARSVVSAGRRVMVGRTGSRLLRAEFGE